MSDVKRGVVRLTSNYGRLGTTLALGLVEVPLLLFWVGVQGFGVITLLGPTIGIGGIVLEVVNQALVREVGAAWHSKDEKRFARTYQSAWIVSLAAALIAAIVFALTIWLLLPNLGIGEELVPAAQWMGVAVAGYSVVNIALAPVLVMYLVREQFVIHNLVLVGRRAAGVIAAATGLWLIGRESQADGVVYYGVVSSAIMAALGVLAAGILLAKDRSFWPRPARGAVREIGSTFGWNTLAIVSLNLGDRVPLILVNLFFGNEGSAIYGVAWRLGAYARMITVGATFGLEAVSTRISSTDTSGENIRRFLGQSTRINATVALPAAIGIAMLAEPLLRLWVGRSLEDPEAVIPQAVIITQFVVVALTIRGISEGWTRILYGDGHVRRYAPFVAVLSVLTPLVCWLAVVVADKPWDFRAIAAVFAVVGVGGFLIGLPVIGARALKTDVRAFVSPMARPAVAAVLLMPILAGAQAAVGEWTLPVLVATIILCGVVFALGSWQIVLTRAERAALLARIGR